MNLFVFFCMWSVAFGNHEVDEKKKTETLTTP